MNSEQLDDFLISKAVELQKLHGRPTKAVIFGNARSFHEAAMRCSEPRPNPDGVASHSVPMLCCLAFACELYLKAILDGTKARGHNLESLVVRLDSDDRKALFTNYAERTGRTTAQTRKDIAQFANAFVEWRYIFEKDTVAIAVLRLVAFTVALYRLCRSKMPDDVPSFQDELLEGPWPEQVFSQVAIGGGFMVRAVGT